MRAEDEDSQLKLVTRTLAEMTHALATVDEPEARLVEALKIARKVVPYAACALLEACPEDEYRLYTFPPLGAAESAPVRQRLIALLKMVIDEEGQAARASTPGSAGAGEAAADPDQTHLAIPLVGLNKVIGILFVQRVGPSYDMNSLRLLTVMAAQLGFFLTTLRLHEDEVEQARQLGIALEQLEQTDRKKDEFLAILGHELRNPLGAIHSALHLLDPGRADEVARYHKIIDRQIGQLSRIVDELLDASRVRLGKIVLTRSRVDLNEVAERWLETYAEVELVRTHEVRLALAPQPIHVHGDPVRIEQIFANLLSNALKYTPAGGQVWVATAIEQDLAVLRIRDNGIGMTPEVLATVFDLFSQADDSLARSQGGMGIGLPLVRSLTEKHGGTVQAASAGLGLGSEFVVRMPLLEPAEAADASRREAPPPEPATSLRLLVVEDNDDSRELLAAVLRRWGHVVSEAADGLQGLHRAVSSPLDVVLVDIGLPRLDGYEVARRLREELGDRTPVLLAMTGYGQPEDRRRATDAGFDGHLVKPLDLAALKQRLACFDPPTRRSAAGVEGR